MQFYFCRDIPRNALGGVPSTKVTIQTNFVAIFLVEEKIKHFVDHVINEPRDLADGIPSHEVTNLIILKSGICYLSNTTRSHYTAVGFFLL